MFCDQCGKPLNANSKFCPSCGKPIASPQVSPAQPGNPLMQQSEPPQPLSQNIEIQNVNESDFEMTTATMVVGIVFFILTLIYGICLFCYHMLNFEIMEGMVGAKSFVCLLFIDAAALMLSPIKGFVCIGKGKSFKSEATTVGICSIIGIVLSVYDGGKFLDDLFDPLDYIIPGIFALVLFIVALCHEK